jgi:hypothetical protein
MDKNPDDENQLSTWNIEIFIQIVMELVSCCGKDLLHQMQVCY